MLGDLSIQTPVAFRIDDVDAAGDHGNGAGWDPRDRTSVRRRIDTRCQARHNVDTTLGQRSSKFSGDALAVSSAPTSADNRYSHSVLEHTWALAKNHWWRVRIIKQRVGILAMTKWENGRVGRAVSIQLCARIDRAAPGRPSSGSVDGSPMTGCTPSRNPFPNLRRRTQRKETPETSGREPG